MIAIGLKTDPRRPINVADEVTSSLCVGERRVNAREKIDYLAAAFRRLGHWESGILRHESGSAAPAGDLAAAEAGALSASNVDRDWLLRCDLAAARTGRRPFAPSWVFRRLHELSSQTAATIWVWEVPFDDRRARGRSRVWSRAEDNSGRATGVQVFVNAAASSLDKGFTMLHEICVHAWRHVRYGDSRSTADHLGRTPRHWDAYHVEVSEQGYESHLEGSRHSLADYEADLLQFIREGRPPLRPELGREANRRHDHVVREMIERITSARRSTMRQQCLTQEGLVWRLYSPSRVGESMRRCGPQGVR